MVQLQRDPIKVGMYMGNLVERMFKVVTNKRAGNLIIAISYSTRSVYFRMWSLRLRWTAQLM